MKLFVYRVFHPYQVKLLTSVSSDLGDEEVQSAYFVTAVEHNYLTSSVHIDSMLFLELDNGIYSVDLEYPLAKNHPRTCVSFRKI